MKNLCCLLAICLLVQPSQAQRKRTSLDDGWKFHFGHAADPKKDFNFGLTAIFAKSGKTDQTAIATGFNDSSWRTLDLPHDWAVELPFVHVNNFDVQSHGYKPVGALFPETSIGWYRKKFDVHRWDSGQRFQVEFDGIFRDAHVWINGFYLGNNQSGYVGAAYDITDYLDFQKPNVLVVRVDATQYEGWFYEGAGIYRHVWLNQYNNIHVDHNGLFAYSKIDEMSTSVVVETKVLNEGMTGAEVSVESFLLDRNGNPVKNEMFTKLSSFINPGGSTTRTQVIYLKHPRLWSLEDPYLYRVVSVVKVKGLTVDSVAHRFGIRTIEIKPHGVFLNGKHIKLLGTNNHQDHAGLGSALPDHLQFYRIKLLKEFGSNAYRSSHNAPTPELLDACDSLGMLVMDEQRLLNSSPEYMSQFERLIKRDRNHPSVFMWCIGNEEGWIQANNKGKRIAQTLIKKQRELDPTRLSTYAADLPNVFEGVNEVIPVRSFNYRQFAVADYHRDHPTQPIIGTEMGSTVTTRGIYEKDSVRAYVPDQDITAPWWASTAEAWWSLAAVNDYWLGGFIWTGFDYRGEPTPYQWPNINSHFGVMDVCGFPKNIYYYYQSWWTGKDVLHISPHWNWSGKEGKPIEVWVNSNAETIELFLNGRSLGKKEMPRNSHLKWTVIYETGVLEAIGYKQGRKISAKVETTGKPYKILLTPDKDRLKADGKDAVVINVSVLDDMGRLVPDAMNLLRFQLEGEAQIIGVGNGDPSSHEPDKYFDNNWQRSLFNGKCQVIIQAGRRSGRLIFSANAPGLISASLDMPAFIYDGGDH